MRATYNVIAGQSLERLAALSDGVFAIALTLLVLDLHVPASASIFSERDLWHALTPLAPQFVAYLMTFMTIGLFWVGQQTQFSRFTRCDRDLAWIHIGFLMAVSLTPFSTALLAEFITFRIAFVAYWLNIFLLGIALLASWRYATRAGLLKEDTSDEIRQAMERRIVVAQALYAFGALLCIVNTYVSIAVIVLVQLNYIFAPRLRLLYRL
ncbi:MAG TPA: TMEM175 family protein [Candidatus Eremiobacteraceae bacterium]|jgi:uncharacterized membrane protein